MTNETKTDATYEETLTACVTAWEWHQWQTHETLRRKLEEALVRQHQTKSKATETVRRDLQRMQISLRTAYRGVLYTIVAEYFNPFPRRARKAYKDFLAPAMRAGKAIGKDGETIEHDFWDLAGDYLDKV